MSTTREPITMPARLLSGFHVGTWITFKSNKPDEPAIELTVTGELDRLLHDRDGVSASLLTGYRDGAYMFRLDRETPVTVEWREVDQ